MTATDRHPAAPTGTCETGIGWRHPHYAALLEQRPALDFIEVHSENFFGAGGAARAMLRIGREHYPVSLHGVGLSLGSAHGLDTEHLDLLAALVQDIEPVRVSDHACFALGSTSRFDRVHASDLLPIPFTREALDAMCANVQQTQDRLRRPIAVENLSAYVQWRGAEMDEPEFLGELARRTGCQLLIDVNNIYVNALNAAHPDLVTVCAQWLDRIEPRTVAELHLAGHVDCGDIVIDDHGSRVADPVWALFRHAQMRFGAVPTLIEWDTDVPALDVLLDEARCARAHAEDALQAMAHKPAIA
ncbi:MAG: DUF692 domain-containing protein [Hydrogenophaga sp.]|uniref:MNIO family bufferin maturase n=1 Tax=Hydrogenophaga sp. TaxID=1904254 RepID=UPI003D0C3893